MTTLRQFSKEVEFRLKSEYPQQECRAITRMLCDAVAPESYYLRMTDNSHFTTEEMLQLNDMLNQMERGRPIQYVTGTAHFYGLELRVDERVLIPRPETEELVQWVEASVQRRQYSSILDIGTGSGSIAIALALATGTKSKIEAWDVETGALSVAQQNAEQHGAKVTFKHVNVLHDALPQQSCYHIIVSNPPYVMRKEEPAITQRVKAYEPAIALFVENDDPLLFYRTIGLAALKMLHPQGELFFEINALLANETIQLLTNMGYREVTLKNDLFGKARMVKAQL